MRTSVTKNFFNLVKLNHIVQLLCTYTLLEMDTTLHCTGSIHTSLAYSHKSFSFCPINNFKVIYAKYQIWCLVIHADDSTIYYCRCSQFFFRRFFYGDCFSLSLSCMIYLPLCFPWLFI